MEILHIVGGSALLAGIGIGVGLLKYRLLESAEKRRHRRATR